MHRCLSVRLASLALVLLTSACSLPDNRPVGTWVAVTGVGSHDIYVTLSQTRSVRDLERPGEGSINILSSGGEKILSYRYLCARYYDNDLIGAVSDSSCPASSSTASIEINGDSLFARWLYVNPPLIDQSYYLLKPASEENPFW